MSEETIPENNNTQLVLIAGESGSGKSASLMNIPNQDHWAYFNCEAGKRLPFRNRFQEAVITDPYQIWEYFEELSSVPEVDGFIVDTITFMMEMFESCHIIGSADTQAAWGSYQQFFKRLMQHYVAGTDKSVIMLGHTRTDYDEKSLTMRTQVPVKGALKNNGLEAYFSTVVATKKVPLKDLEDYENDLLHITEEDEIVGYKHVFQTRLTKSTVGERIRAPMGMFSVKETYIDNDAHQLLQHLNAYYNG